MNDLTPQQHEAITGRGSLLVVAGAGTGKTHTLVSRCLRFVTEERASLENILMVTFTEAAAAEMRARIREELQRLQAAGPEDQHLARQLALLDTARICTLHSLCLQLAREHFHVLGLDPQFSVLDEQQTRPLMREALNALLEEYYSGDDDSALAVQALVRSIGRGVDDRIRKLVLRVHAHSQSLPDPDRWLDEQQARFEKSEPEEWRQWFLEAVAAWLEESRNLVATLAGGAPAVRLCHEALQRFPVNPSFSEVYEILRAIHESDAAKDNWPRGTKGTVRKLLKDFFDGAAFFASLLPDEHGTDPLAQDWEWVRQHMTALISLTREFTTRFTAAKRELAGVDFADLEQCVLRLLREPAIAEGWRTRLEQVFVDEYQDINAAQDAILAGLSRSGEAANRFMVGDVKQSIYRFRLANPKIFSHYEQSWSNPHAEGRRILLTDNFRSREALLNFVNPFFAALMREKVGGVVYEPLAFGAPNERSALTAKPSGAPRVEFHLIARDDDENGEEETEDNVGKTVPDLLAVEREARLLARRLRELKRSQHQVWDADQKAFRKVEWGDMAVLLRSPSGRAEAFAMEFGKAGVPLIAARDGFFTSPEVTDLLHLLRLLDNPLQDVPLAAVLRSPLVGLSLDELGQVRAHSTARPFWTALARFHEVQSLESKVERAGPSGSEIMDDDSCFTPAAVTLLHAKVSQFFNQYHRWRELVRQTSLSQCLETALAETYYEALLLGSERGNERAANVRRLLDLARQFDPYQRQGLYRFLRFVEAQEEEELDLHAGPAPAEDAVRLLSVHKSKGLEFPVVAVACLGTRFNERDLNEPVLLSERHGLCPKVTPPDTQANYPSLPYWVARRSEQRELRGEELRLFYVALTRARDTLILTGTTNRKAGSLKWPSEAPVALNTGEVLGARSPLDWLLAWLPHATADEHWRDERSGENSMVSWQIHGRNDVAFEDEAPSEAERAPGARDGDTCDASLLEPLKGKLAWQYPFAAATIEAAKTSVSAIRRRAAEEVDDETRKMYGASVRHAATGRRWTTKSSHLSAAERGSAHHLFLQLLDLERAGSETELLGEARRLSLSGRMKPEEIAVLDYPAIASFWQSELGRRIRANAGWVRRELAFTARFTPGELVAVAGPAATYSREDFVVVQGVADLAVLRPKEIWLVDFKTDEVTSGEVAAKAESYEPQLRLYALALARIYGRPVTERWLHFLALMRAVPVVPATE